MEAAAAAADEVTIAPPDMATNSMVFSLCFPPVEPLVVVGLVSGEVGVHRINGGAEPQTLLHTLSHHTDSCRAMCVTDNGELVTCSADASVAVVDLTTGSTSWHHKEAHGETGINECLLMGEATNPAGMIATGDDDGTIKLWDVRQKKEAMKFSDHEDYVSAFVVHEDKRTLVSTSGDGTLCAYNLRKGKLECRSDQLEDELLSCVTLKGGKIILCGSQEGVLHTYKWGEWADCSDRFPGHPNSIDAIVALTDDLVLTGSSDGLIRLVRFSIDFLLIRYCFWTVFRLCLCLILVYFDAQVNIQPHKLVGVLGDHGDFPIETIVMRESSEKLNCDLCASSSHEGVVKFWNLGEMIDLSDSEGEESDDSDEQFSDGDEDSEGEEKAIVAAAAGA